MSKDNLTNLRATLVSRGYNPPEMEQFIKDMQDDGNLQRVVALGENLQTLALVAGLRKLVGYTQHVNAIEGDGDISIVDGEGALLLSLGAIRIVADNNHAVCAILALEERHGTEVTRIFAHYPCIAGIVWAPVP